MLPTQLALPTLASTDYIAIRSLYHKRFKNVHVALQGKRTDHTVVHPGWAGRTVTQGRAQKRWMSTEPSLHKSQSDASVIPGIISRPGTENKPISPRARYRTLLGSGMLKEDNHQQWVIDRLQTLHNELINHDPLPLPPITPGASLVSRLFTKKLDPTPPHVPRGLYLYGDVGTGKSMLMDLFYDTLPQKVKLKRRIHFHAFMIDVHKRIHAAKTALGLAGGDPILPVARDLAQEAQVICFDEFQVTDIVDAMILRRLFESLMNYGVVFVITSNRHPDELYKNGIQRSSFIPCISLLKERLDLINLDSGTDYRRLPRALSNVYHSPLTPENTEEVKKIFAALASIDSQQITYNRELTIWGRKLMIPESTDNIAKFTFQDLCGNPLSAADYFEVTKTFKTVFVMDIPKMSLGQKDLARRFITFVDACYENKTKLFVTSEVPIYQVFSDGPDQSGEIVISDHMRSVMDDLGLSHSTVGSSSMFTGEEEVFAFARCCSRLVQMGSREWAESAGQPH